VTAAPTATYIRAVEATLYLSCALCRSLRDMPGLVDQLLASGRGDVPVDRLNFKCSAHGLAGDPYVYGAGNALLGRPQLWPPKAEAAAEM
jgi:hypothetical protein